MAYNPYTQHTPVETYHLDSHPILVKRDDLCNKDQGAPPFAKVRGLVPYLTALRDSGVKLVGYMDTSISMGGWGVAYYANKLGMEAIIIYPEYKGGLRHNMGEHIQRVAQAGGQVMMLENPTQLSINVHRARKIIEGTHGGHLLPQGLPFNETRGEVMEEAVQTKELRTVVMMGGSTVLCIGSGVMASGVLQAIDAIEKQEKVLGCKQPMVYGVLVSRKDGVKLHKKMLKYVPRARFTGLSWRFNVVEAGWEYTDTALPAPFPCNPYYDAKAWQWLAEQVHTLPKPILFWNIGA